MKNTVFRKYLAVLLSVIMVITIMPIAAFGDGEKTVVSITADDKTDIYFGNGWYIYSENGRYFYYNDHPENVTVTYSDGTTFTGDIWEFSDEFGVELDYESNQSYTNQWGLGEHTCTLTLGNIISGTYKVTVVQSNIKSISASPITLTQNCTEDGYYDEDENYFRYNFNPGTFTVTYNDDTTETFTGADDFWQHYEYFIDVGTDQSAQNPWGLGTHTANVSITGVTCQMTVNIVESPVLSVTTSNETVVEGTNGYMSGYWDDATQQYIDNVYFRYNLDIYSKTYTVTYKNGDVFTGTPEEIYNQTGHYVEARDLQNHNNPFTVGINNVPISFYGCQGSFSFTVISSPVQSFTITPVSVVEGSHGYMAGYWDDDLEKWIDDAYFRYSIYPDEIQCTVTYSDGTPTFTGTLEELESQTGYEVIISDPQDIDNQFSVGSNSVPIFFMGCEATLTYTVTPSPIKSISISDVTRTVGESDSWIIDQSGNEYPDYAHPTGVDVTLNDDSIVHYDHIYDIYDDYGMYLSYTPEIDFDFDNQWTPGTYNVTATLGLRTCQYTVTLLASNIEYFAVTDTNIVYQEGTNGSICSCYENGNYVGQYYQYRFNPNIEVHFSDGTPDFTGTASDFENQYGYEVRFMTDQALDNEWDIGPHQATGYLAGIYSSFDVEIIPSDGYVSITVYDYTVPLDNYPYNNVYSDAQGDHYFPKYEQPLNIEIECADGSFISGTVDDIYDETGIWVEFTSDNTYSNQWGVGTHYATATFGELSTTYAVTVVDATVTSVSVDNIEIEEYSAGNWSNYYENGAYVGSYFHYYIDTDSIQLTVSFSNGTTFTGTPYQIYDECGVYPEFSDSQDFYSQWTRNSTNTVTVTIDNVSTTFRVDLTPYAISSVTINPVTIIQNTHGYDQDIWDEYGNVIGSYYYYTSYEPTQITVIFSDGTPTFTGTPSDFNDLYGNSYWFSTSSYQNEDNQWVSGTNTAIAEIGNYRTVFDVVIVNSPISSVSVTTPTMIKGSSDYGYMESEWNEDDQDWTNRYFYFSVSIDEITVTFSDGTPTFTGTTDEFYNQFGYDFYYNLDQSYENQLLVGNNIIPFSLMGYEGTFMITIIESPIQLVNGEIVTTMPGTKLKFYDNFWNEIDPSTDPLGTNYNVECVTDDANEDHIDSMYIVLYGDLSSSDALVNDSDIDEAFNYIIYGSAFYGVLADAADVNHDGVFDAFDIALMDLIASGNRAKEIGLSRGW
ncbi:MAG: hypothetical protein J5877_05925 [Clostridia bacterium]|nr:hypothetical protein [Clostridia bacterium]